MSVDQSVGQVQSSASSGNFLTSFLSSNKGKAATNLEDTQKAAESATKATASPTPKVSVKPTPTPTKAAPKKTITCVKGPLTKKVTGTNPKCPTGYKQK